MTACIETKQVSKLFGGLTAVNPHLTRCPTAARDGPQ